MKDKNQLIALAESLGFKWCSEFDGTTCLVKRKRFSSHYVEIETDSDTGAGMANGKTGYEAIQEIKSLSRF